MEKSIICSNKRERERERKKIILKSYCNLGILLAPQIMEIILENLLGIEFLFLIPDTQLHERLTISIIHTDPNLAAMGYGTKLENTQ